MSIRVAVRSILEDLMNRLRDEVVGCAVSTMDGFIISSAALPSISSKLSSEKLCELGEITSRIFHEIGEVEGVKTRSIVIRGSNGYILSVAVDDALLLILTSENPNLGLILDEMRAVSGKLKELLGY